MNWMPDNNGIVLDHEHQTSIKEIKMSYASKLQEMGITGKNAEALVATFKQMYNTIAKLNPEQLKKFCGTYGLIGHLDMYCQEDGARNLAMEMYRINLYNAARHIDFDEFSDFSDKLYYLSEEAAEVNIPGAKQLCRSLQDLRADFELGKRPFSRLARKAQNIAEVNGRTVPTQPLYEDEDTCIGKLLIMQAFPRKGDNDSGTRLLFVNVELDSFGEGDVKKALRHTLRDVGCHHSYDCCGCVSTYPIRLKKLYHNIFKDTETWAVLMHWYRNV